MFNLMLVHFLGLLTPGPDFFFVVRKSASSNRRNAVCAVLGITLGVTFWATAAMLGLAILFKTLPMLQGMVMLLGGSYLAYLGYLMLKSQGNVDFENHIVQADSAKKSFLQGLLVNLSNAKAIVYFASVMSFVLIGMTELWQIILALGLIIVETFLYFYLLSVFFSRPFAKQFYRQYSLYIDRCAGIVFILFGMLLAYNGILTMLK